MLFYFACSILFEIIYAFSVDPEVYVPREDDTRYNEVDFDSEDTKYNKDYDAQLRDEVAVESVVIIVLVSLLVTLLFFGKLSQRAINPYKISLRGDSSSFSYSFMLYFSYEIGPCFAFFHVNCTKTF